ncbi:hypothetical protein IGI37_002901 [Enterococcus sp. AZ194]|uniref:radical SAM protein n=1 Tax=Enterococcus sp. AZ194 TaxID=2774629 RepID=UPI003F26CDB3
MEKLKYSKFNNIVKSGENLLIYNSEKNTFIKINQELFANYNESDKHKKLMEDLLSYGILVKSNKNEESYIQYKYQEHIMDATLRLTILSSEQCNFRCSYCYEDFKRGNLDDEVAESLIIWLRKNIKNYTAVQISWFGGEPLLGIKKILYLSEEIKKICIQSKRPFSSGITTNGYLLNENNFKKLLSVGLRQYTITIDGVAEDHNKYRRLASGRESFGEIISNLESIRDNLKTGAFRIIIRCNLTKENLKNIDKYIKFMHERFYSDKRFSFIFRPVGDWGGEVVKDVNKELVSAFDDIYLPILNGIKKYPLNIDEYKNMLINGMCDSSRKNYLIVGSEGTIYKCTMLFNSEDNQIGKLFEDGKMYIDEKKVSKWVIGRRDGINSNCMECPFSLSCFERTCAAKGWLLSDEGKCGYEMNSLRHVMTLLDSQNHFKYIR